MRLAQLMPRTRRAEARAAAERQLLELPADVLSLILYQLPLAHNIARAGLTCRQLCDAAKLALKARPFSGEVVTIDGHRDTVHGVAVTADGRIITGSYDKTIKVWCAGACTRTIQAHTRDVEDVAALPGGARFVCVSDDGFAKLWTLDGVLERTFELNHEIMWCVAALPDGVHFVFGLNGGCVRLYHVDGTLVHTFEGHSREVHAVAVTRDGQYIISGSHDCTVKLWSVATKSLVSTCGVEDNRQGSDYGHTAFVEAVAGMPDGQRFLSASWDHTVRVWLLDGTLENTFELHTGDVFAVVALPDNQHALSGSIDKTVKLFNVNDGVVLRTFTHHTNWVSCLLLLPDGRRFISGSYDGTACIVEHGMAFEPDQAWVDAKPKREALTAAVAAARTAREMHVSEKMRVDLEANRIELQRQVKVLQGQIAERERQSEQEGQRIERLSALEEEVDAAAGDPARVQEAQARLTAEIGVIGTAGSVPARRRRDLHEYMVQ